MLKKALILSVAILAATGLANAQSSTTTINNGNAPAIQLRNNGAVQNMIQNRLQSAQAQNSTSMTKAAWMARAEQRFAARDTNGDGKIDGNDQAPLKGQVVNKTITKASFLAGMSNRFDALDKNHDGVLDAADRAATRNGVMQNNR